MDEAYTILRRLLAYLLPYRRQAVVAYGAMLAVTVLTMAAPAVVGWVVDVGLTPLEVRTPELVALPDWLPWATAVENVALTDRVGTLVLAAVVLIGLAVTRSAFNFWQLYLGAWLSHRASYDIRNDFFRHVQRLSFGFHDRTQTGDIMSRAVSDISSVQRFIGEGLLDAVNIPLLFGAVVLVLFRIDAGLAAIALSPLLLLGLVTIRFGRTIEPRFKAVQDQEGVISTLAQENFTGQRVVKAFAREDWEQSRFEAVNQDYLRRRIAVIATFAEYFPMMSGVVALASVLLIWFGGRLVLAGDMTVGTLVSFNLWVIMLAHPTQNLGFLVNRASEAVASGRRYFEIVDTPSDIVEPPDAVELGPVAGRVRFDHVDFHYGDRQVLFDIDFVAEPNTVVALFGPTGSGKSTVVNLLPRFYDVTGGAVIVDGHDVRSVRLDSLRCQIATVLQDTFIFSATIRDNIAFGRTDADDDIIVAAAKAAGAHDFILELPNGYGTVIGERGVNLSGGQRQRIAIARALLTQPRILVLDDATSAVDTETEHRIQLALGQLMQGRTTFVIAQRLLTLKTADQILVMDAGRIVERGRHSELVQAGGIYQRIYELQLKDQEEAAEAAGANERDTPPEPFTQAGLP